MAYFDSDIMTGLMSSMFAWIPSSAFGILTYVFTAIALYSMAQRRGLNKPWLAWIPVVNVWLIGSLSDQYQYVVRGQYRSKRKSLVVLGIMSFVLSMALAVLVGSIVVNLFLSDLRFLGEAAVMEMLMGPAVGVAGLAVVISGVGIAFAIIRYMALYDVYRSMDPNNATLYLVLSILFHVTEPFFLFFNRNKDFGMPPRRQAYAYEQPRQDSPVWGEPKDYV